MAAKKSLPPWLDKDKDGKKDTPAAKKAAAKKAATKKAAAKKK